jgi:TatD DNase family protein
MPHEPNELIDTHAHLTFPEYDEDREDVLKRAWDVNVKAIVVIGSGNGIEENRKVVQFAEKHENVYATVGVHPNDAESVDLGEVVKVARELAKSEKVVAIGEIGLDYYRQHSSKESQMKCFKKFLELASELKLPIAIHDREAHKDLFYTLRENLYELTGGIFHCFSGNVEMAHEAVEMGYYIGIPGVVTFKKADQLHEVVREVPIERLVIETDCPYLAPEPNRGKRNEPAYTKFIAQKIAELKKLSVQDVGRITTINARRAYNLPGMIPVGRVAYPIRKSLYLNITNHCTLACVFCPKHKGNFEVKGYNLKLDQEPNVEDVFRAAGNLEGYDEVVFCGFGEPTQRLEILKVIAKRIKNASGSRIRLDTDGLANLVHGRDILPELSGLIDSVSISMNAPNAESYSKICPSKYGEEAFFAMLSFLESAKEFIPDVTATVVGVPGLDVEACKKLAAEMGVNFRLRKYQEVG